VSDVVQDLASKLRRAREQSGVTLREIADATKLSTRTLAALETNRIEQLPGGIYRRAIVRAYASHVGLDPEATLQEFLRDHPDEVPSWAELMPAASQTPRGVVRLLIGVTSLLLPLLASFFPSRS
jgi:cytoskeletal protein RodZ